MSERIKQWIANMERHPDVHSREQAIAMLRDFLRWRAGLIK